MENNIITISGYELKVYSLNSLIIGSGAAALNAAVCLHRNGIKDIMIATDRFGGGTSNNAGSDKQTYYKMSLSGKEPDSVVEMARDLFNGRCMHGDIALCEAQGSVQSFMRLVDLGVKFPYDKYGSFAGYTTDHDPRSRATSAGPYTSHMMFEALAAEVKRRDIRVLDNHMCISLLTDEPRSRVIGAMAIDTHEVDPHKAFVLFNAENVILGTGGPAGIYETSVYPASQTGFAGMAFAAGASGQNLTESQFGIASVKFRWNLSGSYQQVIPRYLSTDINGMDEKEFLNDHFPDLRSLTKAIFLKGYQWPFDPRKINNYGSSLIDILVEREINQKGRKVFIDYSKNPSGKNGETFSHGMLDPLAADYLKKSGALNETPYERLKAMNKPAIDLYMDHGIDLSGEYLEIAVCAQHNNGGLKGNIWWESDLKHLFPVGEVNGSHGVYRPGGSALNSGQVGSSRAAEFISKKYNNTPVDLNIFLEKSVEGLSSILGLSKKWLSSGKMYNDDMLRIIRRRTSSAAGIFRNSGKASKSAIEALEMMKKLSGELGASTVQDLAGCYQLMDLCLVHFIYLAAVDFYAKSGGRSRGSYLIAGDEGNQISGISQLELCDFSREAEKNIIEVSVNNNLEIRFKLIPPRDVPEQDLWFEKIWKLYLEDNSPHQ
ncbi:MAG: FAD-binding protein [Methanosarcina sp.]